MYAPLDFRFAVMILCSTLPEDCLASQPQSWSRLASCNSEDFLLWSNHSYPVEQRDPRILVIQLGKLPHDLAAALIVQLRHHHLNRYNLIAPLARCGGVLDASLAHAELLSALRSRWYAPLRASIDRRNIHLGAQRSVRNWDRRSQVDVRGGSLKSRMPDGA